MMKSSGALSRLLLQTSAVNSSSSCHYHRCIGVSSSLGFFPLNNNISSNINNEIVPLNPFTIVRRYGSKTPVSKSSLAASQKESPDPYTTPYEIEPPKDGIHLQSLNSRNNNVRQETAESVVAQRRRKRREILKMDPSEYEGYALLQRKPSLLDRRGEAQSEYFKAFAPEKRNNADVLSVIHGDIDLRAAAVKRWWTSVEAEFEVKQQAYNPKRNSILGNDLAAAHFVVYRKGRIRFKGSDEWVTNYRKDAKPGVAEEDLPVMKFELCTLPVNYDPRYRVEAMDCTGLSLRYEGLLNFQNLDFVKWLSFKDAPLIDDWCLDRIARIFSEKLEYIDLSGCTRVTDKGIGTLHRCKNLKTLIVNNMSHIKHLEIVCALLEDYIPELTVVGVDYGKKMEELRIEEVELEQKAKEKEAELEANTITIEPKHGPGPDPSRNTTDAEKQTKKESS